MRIRIKERCFFAGRIYEPGEETILPDGLRGPHRAVQKTHDRIDYGTEPPIDANRILGNVEDVPLYDVVDEHPTAEEHSDEQRKQADEASAIAAEEKAAAVEDKPGSKPVPPAATGEVRTLTHIEQRDAR